MLYALFYGSSLLLRAFAAIVPLAMLTINSRISMVSLVVQPPVGAFTFFIKAPVNDIAPMFQLARCLIVTGFTRPLRASIKPCLKPIAFGIQSPFDSVSTRIQALFNPVTTAIHLCVFAIIPRIKAITSVIKARINSITFMIQTSIHAVALAIKTPIDYLATTLEALCPLVVTGVTGLCCALLIVSIKPIAFGIKPLFDAISTRIQPLFDPVTPLVETMLNAVALIMLFGDGWHYDKCAEYGTDKKDNF